MLRWPASKARNYHQTSMIYGLATVIDHGLDDMASAFDTTGSNLCLCHRKVWPVLLGYAVVWFDSMLHPENLDEFMARSSPGSWLYVCCIAQMKGNQSSLHPVGRDTEKIKIPMIMPRQMPSLAWESPYLLRLQVIFRQLKMSIRSDNVCYFAVDFL